MSWHLFIILLITRLFWNNWIKSDMQEVFFLTVKMVTDFFSQQEFCLVISCSKTDTKNKLKRTLFEWVHFPYQPEANQCRPQCVWMTRGSVPAKCLCATRIEVMSSQVCNSVLVAMYSYINWTLHSLQEPHFQNKAKDSEMKNPLQWWGFTPGKSPSIQK